MTDGLRRRIRLGLGFLLKGVLIQSESKSWLSTMLREEADWAVNITPRLLECCRRVCVRVEKAIREGLDIDGRIVVFLGIRDDITLDDEALRRLGCRCERCRA